MGVGRINKAASLTGFSCKKILWRFAGTGKSGCNTKAAVMAK